MLRLAMFFVLTCVLSWPASAQHDHRLRHGYHHEHTTYVNRYVPLELSLRAKLAYGQGGRYSHLNPYRDWWRPVTYTRYRRDWHDHHRRYSRHHDVVIYDDTLRLGLAPIRPPSSPSYGSGMSSARGSSSAQPNPSVRSQPQPVTIETAWAALEHGRYDSALQAFAEQCLDEPDDAVSRVGYALAAAATGQAGRAQWAMQRAIQSDPAVLESLSLHPDVQATLDTLIARVEIAQSD